MGPTVITVVMFRSSLSARPSA